MAIATAVAPVAQAADWYEALSKTTASAEFNLRYEAVEQDNALKDADALTLRSRITLATGELSGFSATVEMEDSRIVLGQGDYSVPPAGYKPGEYSVIADPETTELNQGFVQYKNSALTVKAGRQIIALDGHRFVGHVGWRQDWQTFDALSVKYQPNENVDVFYGYLNQRNRIFAEAADIDSKDHLFNASYKSAIGKFTAYAYLLEMDIEAENALDTYGVSYAGSATSGDVKWLYSAEFATQSSESAAADFDASYLMLEGGAVFSGLTAKVTYELLGSDNGEYGFSTPLATLHKFNGWSDQFLSTPAQGLQDIAFTLAGSLAGGKWMAVYHEFDADEASAEIDDLGSELNLQYTTTVAEHVSLGVKYATYSAGDTNVDTDKLWVWLNTKF
nr:alginate export family protein [Alteromonas aestuariivivens]